ncbi:MAG: septum site-determining protein MinC [Eubacteriales bacterium]
MKPPVILKSYQHGIALLLDETMNFDELYPKIIEKFCSVDTFFKDTKQVLSIEGRVVSNEEQCMILLAIEEHTSIEIICMIEHNDAHDDMYSQAMKLVNQEVTTSYFHLGDLTKGQTIESESSIIVIGDVGLGASVIAKRNIIIVGALYGTAFCGYDSQNSHYVVALNMSPKMIEIGDFRYRSKEKFHIRKSDNLHPKIAMVKENKIVIEPLTKELLSREHT